MQFFIPKILFGMVYVFTLYIVQYLVYKLFTSADPGVPFASNVRLLCRCAGRSVPFDVTVRDPGVQF